MKPKMQCYFLVLFLLALAIPLQAVPRSQAATTPKIDPRAVDMIRQMTDYLRSLNSFSVHVQTTREIVAPSGMTLDSDRAFDLNVQRPDRMSGTMRSAAGVKQFFYDGKTFTVYTPSLNYYASFAAPPTLDQLFQEAATKYGLEMPGADLIYSNPSRALMNEVTSGVYVGESLVNNIDTQQLAFRTKDADLQIWIQNSNEPVPVKLVITDKRLPGAPTYTALLSGWTLNPVFDPSTFTFVPGPSDRKIPIKEMPGPRIPRTPGSRPLPTR